MVTIRQEKMGDYPQVFQVIENAFENEEFSDHREQFLVERLRKSSSFVSELSIVAEINKTIVGYILLSKIKIKNAKNSYESLALAPVAVLKEYQNKGIGSLLINFAHEKAKELNFTSVILLGHQDYYPKFGYKKANEYGIKLPFEVPEENCMAIELKKDALYNINGIVEYPQEFFE